MSRSPSVRSHVQIIAPDAGPAAVPDARRRVASWLRARGQEDLVDDASLATTELVSNAMLHTRGSVEVRLDVSGAGVRLEVADASPVPPHPLDLDVTATIGRGLVVVAALASRWGWAPEANGKVIWCEFSPSPPGPPAGPPPDPSPDRSPDRSPDGPPPGPAVVVLDVPLGILQQHVRHTDEQVREVRLAPGSVAVSARTGEVLTGQGLHAWLRGEVLVNRTPAAAPRAVGRDAVRGGASVSIEVPPEVAEQAAGYLAALEEIDAYCRAERLLALESSAVLRCFRRWLVGELLAGTWRVQGRPARESRSFELALAEEVEGLTAGRTLVERAPDAAPAAMVGVDRDGVVRLVNQRAERLSGDERRELEKLEAMFESLLEAAPDAIVAVDRGATIRLVNRQAELLFGYARHELLGQQLEILIPESARGVHPAHRAAYFADPVTRPMGAGLELSGRRRDGSEFPVDISLSSLTTDEGLLVTAAVRDLTGTRRMRESLQETHRIAEILQRSMLGAVPARIDGLRVAARYRPAQTGATVGGDWHDVFRLNGDEVGITVGDVGGHGIEAAAVMGRLRTALAAVAPDEPDPGRVLEKVNRMLCGTAPPDDVGGSSLLATALYGRLDVAARQFVYAVAGQPGPVLVDVGTGTARLDEPPPNLLLGFDPATTFVSRRVSLPWSGKLLVFTDGVYERRGTPITASLHALVATVAELAARPVDEVADAVLATAEPAAPRWSDDVALVVVGW